MLWVVLGSSTSCELLAVSLDWAIRTALSKVKFSSAMRSCCSSASLRPARNRSLIISVSKETLIWVMHSLFEHVTCLANSHCLALALSDARNDWIFCPGSCLVRNSSMTDACRVRFETQQSFIWENSSDSDRLLSRFPHVSYRILDTSGLKHSNRRADA